MILRICVVRDVKAECYMNPMFFQSDAQAARSFKDAVNDNSGKSEIGQHPEDYALFALGNFDQRTGQIEVLDAPLHIVSGITQIDNDQLEMVQ